MREAATDPTSYENYQVTSNGILTGTIAQTLTLDERNHSLNRLIWSNN